MRNWLLSVAVLGNSLLFLLLLVGLLVRFNVGWGAISLACVCLVLTTLAIQKNSAIDLILSIIASWLVGAQLLSLFMWPEFIAYHDGTFRLANISPDTVRFTVTLLAWFVTGWLSIALCDPLRVDRTSLEGVGETHLVGPVLAWLSVSVLISAVLAATYRVGIAGAQRDFALEGLFYYAFPADYLAVALACGLGFGSGSFRRFATLISGVLVVYLAVKLAMGWKSPILNVSLAYAVGVFYSGEIRRVLRLIPALLLLVLLYGALVKPVADYVRTREFAGSEQTFAAMATGRLNPLSSRLTEGTLFATSAIDSDAMARANLTLSELGMDFVNRLVPGRLWEVESVDRVFTEQVLGQPPEVPSTFAPGVVGMAELLGGASAAFAYGFAARLAIGIVVALAWLTGELLLKLFLLGSAAISTVSIAIDGYFGGVERLFVVTAILFLGALALRPIRFFLDCKACERVQFPVGTSGTRE